jgi:hypothetical protein
MIDDPMEGAAHELGEVRVRSNVCADSNAWHLVPGELLPSGPFAPPHILTALQQQERTYYRACSVCRRSSFRISYEGCDYEPCRLHGTPSRDEAAQRNRDEAGGEANEL